MNKPLTKTDPMCLGDMPFRQCDDQGCGHFRAPRGARTHDGVDMDCASRITVTSPVNGTVTKLGYTYENDLSYRYVEVTAEKHKYRLYYIKPMAKLGQVVTKATPLGQVQDLTTRYKGITNHVHFEIIDPKGQYVDPTPVVLSLRK